MINKIILIGGSVVVAISIIIIIVIQVLNNNNNAAPGPAPASAPGSGSGSGSDPSPPPPSPPPPSPPPPSPPPPTPPSPPPPPPPSPPPPPPSVRFACDPTLPCSYRCPSAEAPVPGQVSAPEKSSTCSQWAPPPCGETGSAPCTEWPKTTCPDRLKIGTGIPKGNRLVSANNQIQFVNQDDGNIVMSTNSPDGNFPPVWSIGQYGSTRRGNAGTCTPGWWSEDACADYSGGYIKYERNKDNGSWGELNYYTRNGERLWQRFYDLTKGDYLILQNTYSPVPGPPENQPLSMFKQGWAPRASLVEGDSLKQYTDAFGDDEFPYALQNGKNTLYLTVDGTTSLPKIIVTEGDTTKFTLNVTSCEEECIEPYTLSLENGQFNILNSKGEPVWTAKGKTDQPDNNDGTFIYKELILHSNGELLYSGVGDASKGAPTLLCAKAPTVWQSTC